MEKPLNKKYIYLLWTVEWPHGTSLPACNSLWLCFLKLVDPVVEIWFGGAGAIYSFNHWTLTKIIFKKLIYQDLKGWLFFSTKILAYNYCLQQKYGLFLSNFSLYLRYKSKLYGMKWIWWPHSPFTFLCLVLINLRESLFVSLLITTMSESDSYFVQVTW